MRHLTLHILAALSVAIGLLTGLAWIVSAFSPAAHHLDILSGTGGDSYFISYVKGTIALGVTSSLAGAPDADSTVFSYAYREVDPFTLDALQNHSVIKFSYRNAQKPRTGQRYSGITIPCWAIMLVSTLVPIRWYFFYKQRQLRRQRRKMGLCTACGYDLRESDRRCPECGKPISRPFLRGDTSALIRM